MGKIFRLPDHIISQIAAGEVIERPVYAVKELVENAIDAHANHIQIFIEDAGLKKIMIIDNGEGMTKEDLLECFKHHTTSKLSEKHNLLGIKSLGFRGEALSSIASVSTMIIKSRPADAAAGTAVEIDSGKVKRVYTTGMPKGTVIQVDQIFASIPARKKFLKSPRTEIRHILEFVLKTAIAYPHIRITLQHNNKKLLDFPETTNYYDRLKKLVGQDVLQQMVPVIFTGEYFSISGYISKPHLVSQTTQKQYMFINNRPVQEKILSQAVRKGYKGLLDSGSYPLFIIFLTIPHEMVDVNVHPKKETVILADEKNVLTSLADVVAATLQARNSTAHNIPWENMPGFAAETLRDEMLSWDTPDFTRILKHADYMQVHNLYILVPADKGTLVLDQHAAHERILYEMFLQAFKKQKNGGKNYQLKDAIILPA
jgi:DNA mismatch repair protein MutL